MRLKQIETERSKPFMGQNNSGLFYWAIAVAIVGVLLCIYYLIPGVTHVLTFSGSPLSAHYKHAALFGVLAVLGIIGALVTRPKATAK